MYHRITLKIKLAAIWLWNHALLNLPNILHCCNISWATFHQIAKLWSGHETSNVVSHTLNIHHGTCILDAMDVQYLCQLIAKHPAYFLDELSNLLQTNNFISNHYFTIHNDSELVCAGVSSKQLQIIAAEWNEDIQTQFAIQMTWYIALQSISLILTEVDVLKRLSHLFMGAVPQRLGVSPWWLCVWDISGGLLHEGDISPLAEAQPSACPYIYHCWLSDFLQLPKCSVYSGPLSVLILDNAKIHQGLELLKLTDWFGVHIEFLSPYSPNLNPIEEAFSRIKYFLQHHQDYYGAMWGNGILYDMYKVLNIITSSNAKGYF